MSFDLRDNQIAGEGLHLTAKEVDSIIVSGAVITEK